MKNKILIPVLVLLLVASIFVARRASRGDSLSPGSAKVGDPQLRDTAAGIPANGEKRDGNPLVKKNRVSSRVDHADGVKVVPHGTGASGVALSSFLPSPALKDLSSEQLARLEQSLINAKRKVYEKLLASAAITKLPDSGVRIEIPADEAIAAQLRDDVRTSIAAIVGEPQMDALKNYLGTSFEAKFGYYGKYKSTIDLSFDGLPIDDAKYITMKFDYANVELKAGVRGGRATSTNVLRTDRFESEYVPLSRLKLN